ncbi:MAG: PqqD family protein [Candidatus Omnitrophica bacterium]|nr:PqqD family protein [Candidatus Omnitrophota bacterium]
MDLSQRYTIDKDKVTYRIIDNEAVILNLDNGYYYSLNEVGTRIWEAIDKQKDLSQILNFLKEEHQLPERQLKSDLMGLVKDLEKEELIGTYEPQQRLAGLHKITA